MDGKPGLGLSAFACLLTVIGLAIPYWSNVSLTLPGGEEISSHSGLWQGCVSGVGCTSYPAVRKYNFSSSTLISVNELEPILK